MDDGNFEWDLQTEIKRYRKLWEFRRPSGIRHTPELWDERADEWEKELRTNGERQQRSRNRIEGTVEYLKSRGILNGKGNVADIGCGPGRFAEAFAGHAGHVTGFDLSPRMTEYGLQYAKEHGRDNVSFMACDFRKLDIDRENLRKKFDLVFTSITPAVSGVKELQKVMDMSRKYCFGSVFVYADDPLEKDVIRDVLKVRPEKHWDGRGFYALFNLLWLKGFYPEVTYYREKCSEHPEPSEMLAERITEKNMADPTKRDTDRVLEYLKSRTDPDGRISCCEERWYGWILWDVRDSADRDYSFVRSRA